jgi:hypothetical protein
VKSLAADLHLPEPEFINGFPEEGLDGHGILFKIPEEWNAEYRDVEYIQKNPTVLWRCTDEQFKQRVENFNRTMERFSVSLNEFE